MSRIIIDLLALALGLLALALGLLMGMFIKKVR